MSSNSSSSSSTDNESAINKRNSKPTKGNKNGDKRFSKKPGYFNRKNKNKIKNLPKSDAYNASIEFSFSKLQYNKNLIYQLVLGWGRYVTLNMDITFQSVKKWLSHASTYSDNVTDETKSLYNQSYKFQDLKRFLNPEVLHYLDLNQSIDDAITGFEGNIPKLLLLFGRFSEQLNSVKIQTKENSLFREKL